jgi:hypothetical protein
MTMVGKVASGRSEVAAYWLACAQTALYLYLRIALVRNIVRRPVRSLITVVTREPLAKTKVDSGQCWRCPDMVDYLGTIYLYVLERNMQVCLMLA